MDSEWRVGIAAFVGLNLLGSLAERSGNRRRARKEAKKAEQTTRRRRLVDSGWSSVATPPKAEPKAPPLQTSDAAGSVDRTLREQAWKALWPKIDAIGEKV
jgi:succinylarginine dihydrolase